VFLLCLFLPVAEISPTSIATPNLENLLDIQEVSFFLDSVLATCIAYLEITHGFVHPLTDLFPVVSIVFIDGFINPHTPGYLREPAVTYLFPANWLTLPLSFGLLMSPWGGHSVFPNIYRDMRHPYKFKRAVKVTFTFTVRLPPHFCLNI
jgi:amino acid permease